MSVRMRYTPQMRTYDALQPVYLPHLNFFQPPNFTSPVVNTDAMGFRYSYLGDKRIDWHGTNETVDVLLGGSTAFGVGATNDRATIPSILSSTNGVPCLNFGGRAYSEFQELLLFLLFAPELAIRNLFIVSGVNTVYIGHNSRFALKGTTGTFFEENFRQGFFAAHFGWKQRLAVRFAKALKGKPGRRYHFIDYLTSQDIKDLFLGKTTLDALDARYANALFTLDQDDATVHTRIEQAMRTYLTTLSGICRQRGIRLVFFVQPFAPWVEGPFSPEETALFDALDQAQPELWKIMSTSLGKAGAWYVPLLQRLCDETGVPCVDLNAFVASVKSGERMFFVDRVHLTDEGYETLAARIAKEGDS